MHFNMLVVYVLYCHEHRLTMIVDCTCLHTVIWWREEQ